MRQTFSNTERRIGIFVIEMDTKNEILEVVGDITMVREVNESELSKLLELYLHLHEETIPEMTQHLEKTWNTIILVVF